MRSVTFGRSTDDNCQIHLKSTQCPSSADHSDDTGLNQLHLLEAVDRLFAANKPYHVSPARSGLGLFSSTRKEGSSSRSTGPSLLKNIDVRQFEASVISCVSFYINVGGDGDGDLIYVALKILV